MIRSVAPVVVCVPSARVNDGPSTVDHVIVLDVLVQHPILDRVAAENVSGFRRILLVGSFVADLEEPDAARDDVRHHRRVSDRPLINRRGFPDPVLGARGPALDQPL